MRSEMEGIKVRGKGCPKPVREWAQVGVSRKVLEVLKRYRSSFMKKKVISLVAICLCRCKVFSHESMLVIVGS